ncbi:unnamed protein product [Lactuca virosa]|uniref:Uncharacterized protein n=1 Tax=Lactuca virosa TaxID=75947 RepID=A0AAU9M449_9ASTR|nr:unnamed protein product [Lactuca virosa]
MKPIILKIETIIAHAYDDIQTTFVANNRERKEVMLNLLMISYTFSYSHYRSPTLSFPNPNRGLKQESKSCR